MPYLEFLRYILRDFVKIQYIIQVFLSNFVSNEIKYKKMYIKNCIGKQILFFGLPMFIFDKKNIRSIIHIIFTP